eukprot:7066325-Pyramimonas_sp.AAC.1
MSASGPTGLVDGQSKRFDVEDASGEPVHKGIQLFMVTPLARLDPLLHFVALGALHSSGSRALA